MHLLNRHEPVTLAVIVCAGTSPQRREPDPRRSGGESGSTIERFERARAEATQGGRIVAATRTRSTSLLYPDSPTKSSKLVQRPASELSHFVPSITSIKVDALVERA